MPASVRVRVTHLLLRVLSRARECSLARSAFWHASVSRVSRERLARFVTFLVSGTVVHLAGMHSTYMYMYSYTYKHLHKCTPDTQFSPLKYLYDNSFWMLNVDQNTL